MTCTCRSKHFGLVNDLDEVHLVVAHSLEGAYSGGDAWGARYSNGNYPNSKELTGLPQRLSVLKRHCSRDRD